jgi:hypothetical protein
MTALKRFKLVTFIILISIYSAMTENPVVIYSPFSFSIDPMERLLLVNIEKDPDEIYMGFEPQVFNDTINGKGMLVIAWRTDGRVDVYHQPALRLDPEKYDIAGKGLANMVERPMADAFFEVMEKGVQCFFRFTDLENRMIEVRINESHPARRKPFGLLAPMGHAAENPSSMPLIYLHDFYFVRKKHTEIMVKIDGREHQPDRLPIPMDRRKMYFARYSPDPFIVTFNPAFNGNLEKLNLIDDKTAVSGQNFFDLEKSGDNYHISRMYQHHNGHSIQISFEPAFPNIAQWDGETGFTGNFKIEGHISTGSISGKYKILKMDDGYQIQMHPDKGWKPKANKLSLRFLYTVAGIFKKWPKSYMWTADIKMTENEHFHMQSNWERIGD